jgi:peroxiredoxin (alkyl hydroperoxide reductase subunit C)
MESYGVVHPADIALRASFLIDEEFIVRHQVVNDLPLGRDVDDMLRMVDALDFHTTHGEVCPAGWTQGDEGMKDTPEGVAKYLAKNADKL